MEKGTDMTAHEMPEPLADPTYKGWQMTTPPQGNAFGLTAPPAEGRDRRVMVLAGTSGTGAAVAEVTGKAMGVQTWAYGIRDLDIRDFARLRQEIFTVRPTHLVYSVGINHLDWAHEICSTTFDDLFSVNVKGFLDTMQILMDLHDATSLPYKPSVVAISSDAARRPMRTSAIYCASKAALDMMVKVFARERAGQGWRINGVAPGKVSDTGMTSYV